MILTLRCVMMTLESVCVRCLRSGNASGTMGDSSASQNGYFAGFTVRTWMVVVINAFLGQVRNCSIRIERVHLPAVGS